MTAPPSPDTIDQRTWWRQILAGTDQENAESVPSTARRETYLLLPSAADPRQVVDASSSRLLAAELARAPAGSSTAAAATRRALSIGASLGLGRVLRLNRMTIDGVGSSTLAARLAEVLDRDEVRLSLAAGPARPNRKPVARILDPDGQLLGVAKIGWDPSTRALIEREAAALDGAAELPTPFLTPVARGLIDVGALRVLVLEPLDIPDDRIDPLTIDPEVGAVKVLAGHDIESVPLARAPFLVSLTDRLVRHDRGAELRGLIDRLRAVSGHDPVLVGRAHGDWAPWNLRRVPAGLLVWDWERYASGVPVGFDLAHHRYSVHRPGSADVATSAARAESDLRDLVPQLGLGPTDVASLVLFQLMELATRHFESASAEDLSEETSGLLNEIERRMTSLNRTDAPSSPKAEA
ncbi:MAG: hypothetical protein GY929_20050 [Actinomycetia bacterium]|nr:hypothetical protein [Actinomycetes bacterium]